MNSLHFAPGPGEHHVVVSRVTDSQWHAVQNDLVVGHGDASRRPDGRIFVSIDAWHAVVFDHLAEAMLANLPRPLHTVVVEVVEVGEVDLDVRSGWERAGFTIRRREWEYLVPTDPRVTGLGGVRPPSGVTTLAPGEAEEGPLRRLDRVIRDDVEATVGWQEMPAEVVPRPAGVTVLGPSKYAVAVRSDQYVGMLRLAPVPRQPRIGLIAVRADLRRRGIARALLAQVLGSLHRRGVAAASAEVNESNGAAMALFDGVGARRASSNLELVLR
jgi:ribosomal protein S18 acetylase RimI-like enzyme